MNHHRDRRDATERMTSVGAHAVRPVPALERQGSSYARGPAPGRRGGHHNTSPLSRLYAQE